GPGMREAASPGAHPGRTNGPWTGRVVGGPGPWRAADPVRGAGAGAALQRTDGGSGGGPPDRRGALHRGRSGGAAPVKGAREVVDVCAFWVGDAVYGIDVARVDEVLPRVVPLPVADAPPHVEGVVHVHGTAVPIVDLRRLLPEGTPPRTAKPKVILARIGRRRVGLRVDGMAGVRRYGEEEIRPGGTAPGVLGVTADDCRLLDLLALLAPRLDRG